MIKTSCEVPLSAPNAHPTTAERYAAFCDAHPVRELRHEGVTWRYRRVGGGPLALLALPGAAGGGEVFFELANELPPGMAMLLLHYPAVSGLAELLSGLRAVLAAEDLEPTALVGGSFGGLVAQALLLDRPGRVRRVVLSATGPPRAERAAANERWLRRMRWIPMPLLRGLLQLVVRRLMKRVEEDRGFWQNHYIAAIRGIDRAQLQSQYRVSIDFDRDCSTRLSSLTGWDGEMLLLFGSEDPMAGDEMRGELEAAYPGARVEILEGAGHGLSLERPREWRRLVARFVGSAE